MSLAAFILLATGEASAYNAGFRTAGDWMEDGKNRMDLNIWYPAKKGEREIAVSPWIFSGAPNAKCAAGKFPVIVLSHPTPGNRFVHHELCAHMARRGYIVVAPTHPRDNLDNMDDLYTWKQLVRRAENINRAIEIIMNFPDIKESIREGSIGFIGFGAGGAAGLLLGGAVPNCANWHNYCEKAGSRDIYCQKWAKNRVNEMCSDLPLDEKIVNPLISASAIVAPGYGMMFDQYSFEHYLPETLMIGTGADQIDTLKMHCEPIARSLGKRARYYELPSADLGALLSRCPPSLEAEMPDLCLSVTPEQRRTIQRDLSSALDAFFGHYLPPG
ncbi:MAG: dienelactone hydrolase family protein [Desulfovibrio sp.]|nr:dienelactone hydrolase family protein [Desulfovibrio sp.]